MKLRDLIVNTVVSLVFAFIVALIGVNWVMGCGEVFYFPNGEWRTGECWLIPYESVSGKY